MTSHSRWSTAITLLVSQKTIPGLHGRALELAHLNVMNVVIKVINYNYGGPTMSKSLSQNWSIGFSPLLATKQLQLEINYFAKKFFDSSYLLYDGKNVPHLFLISCNRKVIVTLSPSVVSVAGRRQVLWLTNSPVCPEFGKHVLPCPLHSPPPPRLPTPPLSDQGTTGADG